MNNWVKQKITSPIINYFGQKIEEKKFSDPPILLGGCGRSGTTLLLSIISAHPKIFAFPHEVDAFTEWVTDVDGSLEPVRIDRMYRYLITNKIPGEVTRWCEKRPYNVRYIPEILEYHGEGTKFIHIVRDARAVCTSKHPQKPGEYWVSVDRWVNDVSAGLEHFDNPQVLTIKYEDLILSPEKLISQICEFIEEEPVEEIINWYENATVRENRAWFGGVTDIQKESLKKWQKPENRERVEEIMNDPRVQNLMEKLAYI